MFERMDPTTDKLKTPSRGRTLRVCDDRGGQVEDASIKVVERLVRTISGSNPWIIPDRQAHQDTASRSAFDGSRVQSGKQIP